MNRHKPSNFITVGELRWAIMDLSTVDDIMDLSLIHAIMDLSPIDELVFISA